MLVVDCHTLQTVYVLYLVDDVLLNGRRTLDGEDVARSDDTVGKRRTGTHSVMLLYKDLLGEADKILLLVTGLAGNDDLTITTLHLTHSDLTVDLGYDCGVGRVAGLEQFGHTGETTGDVTGLGYGTRDVDKRCTSGDGLSVFHYDVATHREAVGTNDLAVGIEHIASRHLRLVLRLCDNLLAQAGRLIGLGTEGDAFDDIVETQCTGILGDDNSVERVPLGNQVALLHDIAVLEVECRTIRHVDGRKDDICMRIDELQFGESADHHKAIDILLAVVLDERYDTHFLKLQFGVVLGHDRCIGGCIGSHTTGVECTEGQLCTRLTDSLSSDDTDGLAELYHTLGGKVASVTLHADTVLALASEHRTYLDTLDGRVFDGLGHGLCDFLTGGNEQFACHRMDDIVYGNTAENTLIQRRDDLFTVLQGGADQTAQRAAILLGDNHVVGYVDKTTGQVSGVGSLHGGVGKTLTGTVRCDEVLQHRHTFLEVGDNRVLDDLVSFGTGLHRLGHQTTHT